MEGTKAGEHQTQGGAVAPAVAAPTTGPSAPAEPPQKTLRQAALEIQRLLRTRRPRSCAGVPAEAHQLPPFIPKIQWTELGNLLKAAENPHDSVPGEYWISLRLDGSGFSTLLKRMRAEGIFKDGGHSPEFGDMMKEATASLMSKFTAKCGYTHSDEITCLIPPARILRDKQNEHGYGGRVVKLITLATSHVTALFCYRILELCRKINFNLPMDMLPQFDCRMGKFKTEEEAMAMLWWRAYDCGVNGVSDTVHLLAAKGSVKGAKSVARNTTEEKLGWLYKHNQLPLPPHVAYGSLFVRVKRNRIGFNPRDNVEVHCLRGTVEQVKGTVLTLTARNELIPPDDKLDPSILELTGEERKAVTLNREGVERGMNDRSSGARGQKRERKGKRKGGQHKKKNKEKGAEGKDAKKGGEGEGEGEGEGNGKKEDGEEGEKTKKEAGEGEGEEGQGVACKRSKTEGGTTASDKAEEATAAGPIGNEMDDSGT